MLRLRAPVASLTGLGLGLGLLAPVAGLRPLGLIAPVAGRGLGAPGLVLVARLAVTGLQLLSPVACLGLGLGVGLVPNLLNDPGEDDRYPSLGGPQWGPGSAHVDSVVCKCYFSFER